MKKTIFRATSMPQYRNDIENHLHPYGIDFRDWNNYHGQGYDAFDLPKIPKRSISISFDQGKIRRMGSEWLWKNICI